MHDIVYIFYLKQQKALQFVCCQTDNRAKFVDKQWLFNPKLCIQKTHAETLLHQPGFQGFCTETGKKKKIRTAKRNPYTSCFQEWTLCVCKTTNKKGLKKKEEKKKKEKLSISSENQRRLPHWLFPFVILIVLMTPKIPKISFSVRSAFRLCSFIILTLLSDVWHVWPQLRYPKEIVNLCDSGCWSGKGCFLCFSSCVRCPLHVFRMHVQMLPSLDSWNSELMKKPGWKWPSVPATTSVPCFGAVTVEISSDRNPDPWTVELEGTLRSF